VAQKVGHLNGRTPVRLLPHRGPDHNLTCMKGLAIAMLIFLSPLTMRPSPAFGMLCWSGWRLMARLN